MNFMMAAGQKSGGWRVGRGHERMEQLVIETFNQKTIAINN